MASKSKPELQSQSRPQSASAITQPGRHAMGGGLLLQVTPSGGKSWIFRFQRHGQRHDMGLGPFPAITLAGARELVRRQRALLALGRDPLAERRAGQDALRRAARPPVTLAVLMEEHIAQHEAAWRSAKSASEWRASLRNHAGSLLDLEPAAITTDHVLAVLRSIWASRTVTAKRVRQRLEVMLDAAKARGLMVGDNPARWRGNLAHLLPNPARLHKTIHYAALDWRLVPNLMARLMRQGMRPAALALRFIVLTAARASEATWATWDELDFSAGVWIIPSNRMKSGREHRVPLNAATVLVLHQARAQARGTLVFEGASPGRPVSLITLSKVLGAATGGSSATVHGLRSSFRDWASETDVSDAVAEACLAHARGQRDRARLRQIRSPRAAARDDERVGRFCLWREQGRQEEAAVSF
jgi:integrase